MKRPNVYLTEKQVERLQSQAKKEGVAVAELVRGAVDAFLAWNDPTYTSDPSRPQWKSHSSPLSRDGAF